MSKKKQSLTQFTAKVIIVGDSAVGKTNILLRFCNNQFKPSMMSTVGIDFRNKTLQINGNSLKLQLWDTAGQERFKNVNQTYFKGARAVALVYSIIDKHSFQSIQSWVNQINQHSSKDIVKFLVASKSDLEYDRKVSTLQGLKMAKNYGMEFIEVSAKEDRNIKQLFNNLSEKVLKTLTQKSQKNKNDDKIKKDDQKEKGRRISLDRREDKLTNERCKC